MKLMALPLLENNNAGNFAFTAEQLEELNVTQMPVVAEIINAQGGLDVTYTVVIATKFVELPNVLSRDKVKTLIIQRTYLNDNPERSLCPPDEVTLIITTIDDIGIVKLGSTKIDNYGIVKQLDRILDE